MKKQYRRRRTESSESDNGREEGEMEEQSRSPPSKLPRRSEGGDRNRKNGTWNTPRAADDDGPRRRDRDYDDADHRRRDGRDPRASAPERTQARRDGGISYGRLAVGGSGSLSYRNGEREREREAREMDARNGKGRDTRRSAVAAGDDYRYDPRSGRRVLVPPQYRQDALLDRDRDRSGRDRERDRESERERESTRDRQRERARDSRDRESTRDRARESTRDRDRERDREGARDREKKSTRDRDRERDRERDSSRDRDRERDRDRHGEREERERDRSRRDGREGSSDFAQDAAGGTKKKSTTGIFSYIASSAAGTAATTTNNNNNNDNSPAGMSTEGGGDTAADAGSAATPAPRAVRPNSSALSNILRSDRRINNRLDREQFDAAQSRLRKLAPEGDVVKDNFRCVFFQAENGRNRKQPKLFTRGTRYYFHVYWYCHPRCE